eukprot:3678813-Rhodomonas_salina.1
MRCSSDSRTRVAWAGARRGSHERALRRHHARHLHHRPARRKPPLITACIHAPPRGFPCKQACGSSLTRSTPTQIIRTFAINDEPIGRSIDEVYRQLEAAQFAASNQGKGCPANWKP